MSMYDNIRARQYVDFLNNQQDDDCTDSSAFFCSDADSSFKSVRSYGMNSCSTPSSNGTESDYDKTLTPNVFDLTHEGNCSMVATDEIHEGPCEVVDQGGARTPTRPTATVLPFKPCLKQPGKHQDMQLQTLRVTINVVPPTPPAFGESVPKASTPFPTSNEGRRSRGSTSTNKRRSRSAGSCNRKPADDNEILQEAMGMLNLSGKKEQLSQTNNIAQHLPLNVTNPKPSPQRVLSNCIPSSSQSQNQQSAEKGKHRPKRKLSPGSKQTRECVQQPEKYMSMAGHIAQIEKQVPNRFLRNAGQSKLKNNVNGLKKPSQAVKEPMKKKAAVQINADRKESDGNRVRVARLPAPPQAEPFKFTEYNSKELPRTVFSFDKKDNVLLRDRRTPIKKLKSTTKVEPFSFDKKDQEFIQRKLLRAQGVLAAQEHCSKPAPRQRSKSHGAEPCTGSEEQKHHARIPTVLYKPPFKPQKSKQKPTEPIGMHLSTERRARERETFDEHLRQKEQERANLLHQLRERQRLEAELEVQRLRKELVHKAQPMPVYHKFEVHPSDAPLTDPFSPNFMRRSREKLNQKENLSNDESMEM